MSYLYFIDLVAPHVVVSVALLGRRRRLGLTVGSPLEELVVVLRGKEKLRFASDRM